MNCRKYMAIVLICILTLSLGITSSALAQATDRVYLGRGKVTTFMGTLYHDPIHERHYALPIIVNEGSEVDVYEATDEFYYVKHVGGKYSGFILQSEVKITSQAVTRSKGYKVVGTMQATNSSRPVPMFSEADIKSEIFANIPDGAIVSVLGKNGNFKLCTYDSYTGWIHSQHLTDEFEREYVNGSLEDLGTMYVVNCEEWVSLRDNCNEKAKRLEKVTLGEAVMVHRFVGDWVLCTYNQKTGWILGMYLSWQR